MKNSHRIEGFVFATFFYTVLAVVVLGAASYMGYGLRIISPVSPTEVVEDSGVVAEPPVVTESPAYTSTVTPTVTLTPTPCNSAKVKEGGAGLYPEPDETKNPKSLATGTLLCLQGYKEGSYWVYVTVTLPDHSVLQGWIYAPYISVFPDKEELTESWAEDAGLSKISRTLPTSIAPVLPTATATSTPVVGCINFTARNGGAFVYLTADSKSEVIDKMNTGDSFCGQAFTGKWLFGTSLDSAGMPVQGLVYVTRLENFAKEAGNIPTNWHESYGLPPYNSQSRPGLIAPPTWTPNPTNTVIP